MGMEAQGENPDVAAQARDRAGMEQDLRGWGLGLMAMGGISILSSLFAGFLDPYWGGLLMAVGVLALIIRRRGMFIAIGVVLLLAGALNLLSGLGGLFGGAVQGSIFWTVFGGAQLYWGVQEIRKFGRYALRDIPAGALEPQENGRSGKEAAEEWKR
jgi:hypothetical protein